MFKAASRPLVSCYSFLRSITFSEDVAEPIVIPTKNDITSFPLENNSSASPSFPVSLSHEQRAQISRKGVRSGANAWTAPRLAARRE